MFHILVSNYLLISFLLNCHFVFVFPHNVYNVKNANSVQPVSYTHLDVYKRQMLWKRLFVQTNFRCSILVAVLCMSSQLLIWSKLRTESSDVVYSFRVVVTFSAYIGCDVIIVCICINFLVGCICPGWP